jgi:hypothetical protein
MTAPTNHHLTLTDSNGKQVCGKVVSLQPKQEQWHEGHTVVHIVTSDWLDPSRYEAVYGTPVQSFAGFYIVLNYGEAAGQWLFIGTFERSC